MAGIEEIGVIEPVNIEIEEGINTVKVDIKGEVNLPVVDMDDDE